MTAERIKALEDALRNIRELNETGADENGHRWVNSDLIEQEIVFALAASQPAPETLNAAYNRGYDDCLYSAGQTAEPESRPVTLTYTNWRGDTEMRRIIPRRVWWGSTEWHPEPQWLLTAFDMDKEAERDFALADFHGTEGRALAAQGAALERAAQWHEGEKHRIIAELSTPHFAGNERLYLDAAADHETFADAIRALITPTANTVLDAALADARREGKLEGVREAKVELMRLPDMINNLDRLDALAARMEGGDA